MDKADNFLQALASFNSALSVSKKDSLGQSRIDVFITASSMCLLKDHLRISFFPFFRADEVAEFGAYHGLVEGWGQRKKSKKRREAEEDFLGVDQPSLLLSDDTIVAPCFASLFQGDHLGVEIATEAHAGMLEAYALLKSPSRLQSGFCLQGDPCVEGLYIDDYFAISREDVRACAVGEPSFRARSSEAFYKAKEAYTSEEVFGSDDKDVLVIASKSSELRSIPGFWSKVDWSLVGYLLRRGCLWLWRIYVCFASGDFRRFAFQPIVGSIISMLLFRRPAMSALQEVFHVIPSSELNTQEPKLWKLSRSAASELAVVAALVPVLASNLAAPTLPKIFATLRCFIAEGWDH